MVPLAATCMLAMPVHPAGSMARPAEHSAHTDRGAVSTERERRTGLSVREEAAPHDPPHEVAHWSASARPRAGDVLAQAAAHGAALALPAPVGSAPNEFQTPEAYLSPPGETRGPPAPSDMA